MNENIFYDETPNEDALKALVAELTAAQDNAVETVKSFEAEDAELAEEIQKLRALIVERSDKRRDIEAKKRKAREEARAKAKQLEEQQRKLTAFMSEKAIRDREAREFAEIDARTQGAYWREFAYDHQIDGAKRLASARRALLGDKTGLGKTATSIIWMDMVNAKKIIVVAPRDVLRNFEREIKRWAPHRNCMIMQGMGKQARDFAFGMLQSASEFILLVNYEAWRRDPEMVQGFISLKADTIIMDEAHNMKEGTTSAYRGVREIVYAENVDTCVVCNSKLDKVTNSVTGITRVACTVCFREPEFGDRCSVKNVLPMSATVIMNKPQDFFTVLHLIDRETFPKLDWFLQDYCEDRWGKWYFRAGGEKRLQARLGARIVARDRKSAGVNMPDQVFIPHYLEQEAGLYERQWKAMKQIQMMCLEEMSDPNFQMVITAIIAMYTRLRQAVTWPAGIKIRDPKTKEVIYECDVKESIILDKTDEIIDLAVLEGDRVVVFSQFKEVLKEVENRLNKRGITCVRLDGDTPDKVRDEITLDFDSKSADDNPALLEPKSDTNPKGYRWQVCLANYKTGGTGLNLDLARQVIMTDRSWNPATEEQAAARVNRVNTKHDSVVHTIHVANTVTAWMDEIMEYKQEMKEGIETDINMAERFLQALKDGF